MSWPTYRERYLPAMRLRDIEAIPDREKAVVVVATGAIEQHGPQLPVGVDALLGQVYLDRALPLLPQEAPIFIAPPIQAAKSNEHDGFPGTLILSRETLRRQLLAVAAQLGAWGFRRIRVLNTHGGNVSVIKSALREMHLNHGLDADLLRAPYESGVSERESTYGIHANEVESGLIYAACPEMADPAAAVCRWIGAMDDPGELRPEFAPATYAWKSLDLSRSGVMGDATAGTAEKGDRWIEQAAQAIAAALLELV